MFLVCGQHIHPRLQRVNTTCSSLASEAADTSPGRQMLNQVAWIFFGEQTLQTLCIISEEMLLQTVSQSGHLPVHPTKGLPSTVTL